MNVETVKVPRTEAKERWKDYLKHKHWSEPVDAEIQRVYHAISQGRVVIRALHSIQAAGLGEDKLPKLAIARSDCATCTLHPWSNGSATMTGDRVRRGYGGRAEISFPAGTFPGIATRWAAQAIVPPVPLHARPKRALQNYFTLFEAVWHRAMPEDPMLLRRLGRGDMWLVVHAWELTEVERIALGARLSG